MPPRYAPPAREIRRAEEPEKIRSAARERGHQKTESDAPDRKPRPIENERPAPPVHAAPHPPAEQLLEAMTTELELRGYSPRTRKNYLHHVRALLAAVENPKHRAALTLVYSAGLRVSEVVRLRIADLDEHRGLLTVRGGKGGKDRVTLLADAAIAAIRLYRAEYQPTDWLFPGERPRYHLNARTIQHAMEAARRRTGIEHRATVHTLRHCFATHLLEAGTDLRYIQESPRPRLTRHHPDLHPCQPP